MDDDLHTAIIASVTDAADVAERRAIDELRRQYRKARFLVVSVAPDGRRRSILHLTFDRADDSAAFERLTRCSLAAMLDAIDADEDADEPGVTHVLQAGGTLESRGIASDLALHAGMIRRSLVAGVDCAAAERHAHWPDELGARHDHLAHSKVLEGAIREVCDSVEADAPLSRASVIAAYHRLAEAHLVTDVAGGDPMSKLVQALDRILSQHLAALGESVAGVITRDSGIVAAVNAARTRNASGLQPEGDAPAGSEEL